ncbi:hypothetical protein KEJ14_01400 [Candidatus Bathyarchaeota archaeon]|nr:hypothetical protein [Candidatus Bathyarchaeota archaeon]
MRYEIAEAIKMLIHIIISSVNVLTNLKKIGCADNDIKIIVVDEGDEKIRMKNDKILAETAHEYYGPKEREKWFKERFGGSFEKYLGLIPERCHAETSFGFLRAYEDGADVVIELDDDVYISGDFLKAHVSNLLSEDGVTVHSRGRWYNTIDNLLLSPNEKVFPRGHPYTPPCRDEDYTWINQGGKCILNMGLWSGQPDLDALTIIYHGGLDGRSSIKSNGIRREKIIVDKRTYFAICSMNTSFLSKAIPAFYQLYMNFMDVDRFDDIWSGIFLKRIADHIGDGICLGKPLGFHDKRPRNIFKDLKKEASGLDMNELIWKICDEAIFSAKTYPDCYLELANHIEKEVEKWFKEPMQIKFWRIQVEKMRLWVEAADKIK